MRAEAGSNWIENDVTEQFQQMHVAFDEGRVEATVENMAFVPVPPVEPLRIAAV